MPLFACDGDGQHDDRCGAGCLAAGFGVRGGEGEGGRARVVRWCGESYGLPVGECFAGAAFGGCDGVAGVDVCLFACSYANVVGECDGDGFAGGNRQFGCVGAVCRRECSVCRYVDECGGVYSVRGVGDGVGECVGLFGEVQGDDGAVCACLLPVCVVHVYGEVVERAGGVGDPCADVYVHGAFAEGGVCGNAVVVCLRRLDRGVALDLHGQCGGAFESRPVSHGVADVVGAFLVRCVDGDGVAGYAGFDAPLYIEPAVEGGVRSFAGDVVGGDGYRDFGSGSYGDAVVAGRCAGMFLCRGDADADHGLGPSSGPVLHGVGERVGAVGVGVCLVCEAVRVRFDDSAELW